MSTSLGFDRPIRAVVIGAGGGIGAALVQRLMADPGVAHVSACARQPLASGIGHAQHALDITDEPSIAAVASTIGAVDLVLVATGLLHGPGIQPEKTWRSIDPTALMELYRVNAVGPMLVAKHFLPLLPRQGRSLFAAISAKVGSIEDNRLGGWYGYRAAKAALNQLLKTAAIELVRTRPDAVVAALHPGTVTTRLSEPFRGGVSAESLVTPDISANNLLTVLGQLGPADSGGLFAWSGQRLPY